MLEQRSGYAFESEEAASDRGASIKLKTLKELTLALLQEVESFNGGDAFDGGPGIDFAEEVRRFETDLIRWALLHTGGHQRRAAHMLKLKVTTLNAKIKRYGIRPHAPRAAGVLDLYSKDQAA
ncbi:MAG TPA: helix-turn-helix domain-containing protein [Pyrinomonadaceae bacterium]|jgi:DNA-binding NtrC family response regulator|nr:helix-turn-helix domain-containing protein [Pyrinomonadaceae bacterium]